MIIKRLILLLIFLYLKYYNVNSLKIMVNSSVKQKDISVQKEKQNNLTSKLVGSQNVKDVSIINMILCHILTIIVLTFLWVRRYDILTGLSTTVSSTMSFLILITCLYTIFQPPTTISKIVRYYRIKFYFCLLLI